MQAALRSSGLLGNDDPAVGPKSGGSGTEFIRILRAVLHRGGGAGDRCPRRIEDEHIVVVGRTTQRIGPLGADEGGVYGQDIECLSAAKDVQRVAEGQRGAAGPPGIEIALPGAGCSRSEVAAIGG